MSVLEDFRPQRVFKYFEEISGIPRGSGNMVAIADYCVDFAKAHMLEYARDKSNNVIIYKPASPGRESSPRIILQAHLDMVCQKEEDTSADPEKDGVEIHVDGQYAKAKGTTLGADDGIGVAMILAILEDGAMEHPPLEAVFTTDEEIGMLGAAELDFSYIEGRHMINIDSDEEAVVTASCAGGEEFTLSLPLERFKTEGTKVCLEVRGLAGGHSGVDIDKGRENANILMGKILSSLYEENSFFICDIQGGDKTNAIPVRCRCTLLCHNSSDLIESARSYGTLMAEMYPEEDMAELKTEELGYGSHSALTEKSTRALLNVLCHIPDGVIDMSKDIDGLVETSLNLGILRTNEADVCFASALRSNSICGLSDLKERLVDFAEVTGADYKLSGAYPPWEFNKQSAIRDIYIAKFKEVCGYEPAVEAIHAGLECGLFARAIDNLDCISIGPDMEDIHTVKERLSISSVERVYRVVTEALKDFR